MAANAGTYTRRDRHVRIIGVERCLLCITPMGTPAYPLHLFHTKDEEDFGEGNVRVHFFLRSRAL